MSQLRLHTASGSSSSLHVPAALAAHHRPVVDAALDALFAGTLDDAHPHRASDGTLVVWLSPPEAARAVAEAYAARTGVELRATCSLCGSSARCPVHTEVAT